MFDGFAVMILVGKRRQGFGEDIPAQAAVAERKLGYGLTHDIEALVSDAADMSLHSHIQSCVWRQGILFASR